MGPYLVWVYGSPAVCRWREPIVYRILGHNRWPTVPRVFYPDRYVLTYNQVVVQVPYNQISYESFFRFYSYFLGFFHPKHGLLEDKYLSHPFSLSLASFVHQLFHGLSHLLEIKKLLCDDLGRGG
jgi:hypothetical protein